MSKKPQKIKTRQSLKPKPPLPYSVRRVQWGLVLTLLGFGLFILGARPDVFGANRSPVLGFIQLSVFEVGLGVICLGGYTALRGFWKIIIPASRLTLVSVLLPPAT